MTCIFRRVSYVDYTGGTVRFLPWNVVLTSLGNMWEPRQLCTIRTAGQYDPTDEAVKVNDLENARIDAEWTYLSPAAVHGGMQLPTNYSL